MDCKRDADGVEHPSGAGGPATVTPTSLQWLHEHHQGPFVRNRLTETNVRTVWRLRGSALVEQTHDRHGDPVEAPVLVALGQPDEVATLLREVGPRLPRRPGFVTVEASAFTSLPPGWRYTQANRWDSMWTEKPPAPVAGEDAVEVVADDEVRALLAVGNPGSHGQPGDPRIRAWLGIRDRGDLVAAGALAVAAHSSIAHLRGVTTHPGRRRRGLGTAVSAALTRLGLDTVSPLVTLGVYTWNATAISIYRRLGYHHDRSFVSGPLES